MIIENIRNLAIGIGIMILLPLMVHVGIRLIVKEPLYPQVDHNKYESEEYKSALQQYKVEKKSFEKYYFYIAAIIGIVFLIAGVLTPLPFLGMGFILGGIFCLVIGYFRYWDELSDLLKFISLLLAFILLIFSSFKFVKNKK